MYWKNVTKIFFLHVWDASITLALMWAFEPRQSATIMHLAYTAAYSGLLLYQYNRIFTGPEAATCLTLGSIVGFLTGIILHSVIPAFTWISVIGLGAGTCSAAIYSMIMADIGLPSFKSKPQIKEVTESVSCRPTYTCSSLEPFLNLSKTTMEQTFDSINALPKYLRHRLDAFTHPGSEVKKNIFSIWGSKKSVMVQAAFPNAENLVSETVRLSEAGKTVVEFVSAEHLQKEQRISVATRLAGDELRIFVVIGPGFVGMDWTANIRRNCKAITQAVVQATAEARLGIPHGRSIMAELLLVEHGDHFDLSLPEGVKYQLGRNAVECARVANYGRRTFLRHLMRGIDSDLEWDNLPESARSFLVRRCAGISAYITSRELEWLHNRAGVADLQGVGVYVTRHNLGVGMSMSVSFFARHWIEQDAYPGYPVLIDSTFGKPFHALLI